MPDELGDLLDTAIYKEIASQALYLAAQKKTSDPGARSLMKDLALDESRHSQKLTKLKDRPLKARGWQLKEVPDLMLSEYLVGADIAEDAGLQDLLIFAMRREQQSVEFYSRMMSITREETARHLCERLVQWELSHKLRLELLYDDLFYKED